jgi:hypothetical protein
MTKPPSKTASAILVIATTMEMIAERLLKLEKRDIKRMAEIEARLAALERNVAP